MEKRNTEFSLGRRWLIFAAVFLMAICVALNMMKAPPIFTVLIPELGFTESTIGLVVSSFVLVGVILAFPAGALVSKFGIKALLIGTGLFTILGSILGTFATESTFMLASRFVEGIAYALISVAGIAAVSLVMPNRVKGLAMGIWSIWYPLGTVLGMLLSPTIAATMGWRVMWWIVAALTLVATVFVIAVYAEPKPEKTLVETGEASPASSNSKPDFRSIIFLSLSFLAWNVIWAGAINGFYPTFLQNTQNMNAQEAGFIVSLPSLIVLILGPISGIVSDRLGTRKWLAVFAMAGVAILCTIAFSDNMMLSWIFVLLVTIPACAMPTGVFAGVPELAKRPESVGLAMGILAFLQNLGVLIGSAAFGPVSVALGWQRASWFYLIPVAAIGLICALLVREKRKTNR
jgi:predicted MFS family arabinose efflux permease